MIYKLYFCVTNLPVVESIAEQFEYVCLNKISFMNGDFGDLSLIGFIFKLGLFQDYLTAYQKLSLNSDLS